MNFKYIITLWMLLIFLSDEMKAQYTDPGSTSFIFQFLLIMFGFLLFYFQKVRLFISRIWKKIWRKDSPK